MYTLNTKSAFLKESEAVKVTFVLLERNLESESELKQGVAIVTLSPASSGDSVLVCPAFFPHFLLGALRVSGTQPLLSGFPSASSGSRQTLPHQRDVSRRKRPPDASGRQCSL